MKPQLPTLARHWNTTPLVRILGPLQRFIQQEASSGIILLCVTVVALLLAHSPLAAAYAAVLETQVSLSAGPFVLSESVLHWINDGLMAVFFFVVGLEIKREMLVGELASPRAALRRAGPAGLACVPEIRRARNDRGRADRADDPGAQPDRRADLSRAREAS